MESKLQEVDSDSNSDNHSLFEYNFWHQVENQQVNNSHCTVNELVLKQSAESRLNVRNVILLDSKSTVCVFCNLEFVTDIKQPNQPLTLQSNGGMLKLHKVTMFSELGNKVCFQAEQLQISYL